MSQISTQAHATLGGRGQGQAGGHSFPGELPRECSRPPPTNALSHVLTIYVHSPTYGRNTQQNVTLDILMISIYFDAENGEQIKNII